MTVALLLAILAAPAPPSVIAFKKGDVSLHRRTITLSGAPAAEKSEVRLVLKPLEQVEVKDVNSRGEATVVATCVSMEIVRDGRLEKPENAKFPSTTRVFSKGGLLLGEMDGSETAQEPLLVVEGMVANIPMPRDADEAAAGWRTELQNRLTPGQRVIMTSQYLGAEQLQGIHTEKTSFSLEVPTSPARVPSETILVKGVRWIDTASGRIVKSDIEVRNVSFPLRGGTVKGLVHIEDEIVVPAAGNKAPRDSAPSQGERK